ncbi:MAG: protein kinase domain-containing protein [Candidatus Acidiferrales bacterium]
MLELTLGRYRIIEKIGVGGMGEVYRAHDEHLDRDVALKVLPTGAISDDVARKRFRKEALALSKLNHPSIATVFDFDTQNDVDFLVMELIPGVTLNQKLAAGPLPEKEIFRLGSQLAEGLTAAHAQGIVHRDLKPGNLRVLPDGRLKILDFGLAKLLRHSDDLGATSSLTETKSMAGTLPYMSPEQLRGEPADSRSDIYAAGVVLYEMATGQRPFPETHGPRLIDSILHQTPPRPSELSRNVSPSLETIILKALDKDPERRYQSARELRVDLERTTAALPTSRADVAHESVTAPQLEIAHVLFMDIVAYSRLPMDQQQRTLRTLQDLVRGTSEFARAEARQELVRLPTGDGMALVFFHDPEAPVRCALELGAALKNHPEIPLRMGIHSGPVYRVADINANRNVAGGGINFAQRVMDCGDAGHILVSKAVADVLTQISNWKDSLSDLGEVEVKHGVKVHLFNLHTPAAGNPERPQKVSTAILEQRAKRARFTPLQLGLAVLFVALVGGAVIGYLLHARHPSIATQSPSANAHVRRSVAVLDFQNLSGRSDADWLSNALPIYFDSDLGAGEKLRLVSGEDVVHMERDLALPHADALSKETLKQVRNYLNTDLVVLGSYTVFGNGPSEEIRLDLRLQDARQGDTVASTSVTGNEKDVFEVIRKASDDLRAKLGIGGLSGEDSNFARASLPENGQAARFYSEGLSRLRLFDALGARTLLEKAIAVEPAFPLAHSALASALSRLGFDAEARDEAKKALDLSKNLSREEKFHIKANYDEMLNDWTGATKIYASLWIFFPDNPEYGLSLAKVQTSAGNPKDALATLQKLRSLPPPAGDDPRIDLEEAEAAGTLSDFKLEQTEAEHAFRKAQARGAQLLAATALWQQCWALQNLGEISAARAACEQSKKMYVGAGDQLGTARGLTNIANIFEAQGDLNSALELHKQALHIVRGIGAQKDIAGALENIANVYAAQGRLDDAKKNYQEAFQIAKKIGNEQELLQLQNDFAADLYTDGDYTGARETFGESLHTALEIGDRGGIATAKENLAQVLSIQGDLPGAIQSIQEAIAIQQKGGMTGAVASSLQMLGDFLLARDDLAGADKNYKQALNLFMQLGDKGNIAGTQLSLSELALAKGQPAQAETLARQAAHEFQAEKQVDNEAGARGTQARALMAQNKLAEAQKEIANAQSLAVQDRAVRVSVAITAARLQARMGKPADALKSLQQILTETGSMKLVSYELEAELAKAEIELQTDPNSAGTDLKMLEKEAKARDFLLIARKARDLAKPA